MANKKNTENENRKDSFGMELPKKPKTESKPKAFKPKK